MRAIDADALVELWKGCTFEGDITPIIKNAPTINQWIPCSERLPENTDAVNITWINRDPESYYSGIKDKPFTATGHYCKGKWYWHSAVCKDYLDEYGNSPIDIVAEGIEIVAWKPLPEPYRGNDT